MRLSITLLDHVDPLVCKDVEAYDFKGKFLILTFKSGDVGYFNVDRIIEIWVSTKALPKVKHMLQETARERQPELPYSS